MCAHRKVRQLQNPSTYPHDEEFPGSNRRKMLLLPLVDRQGLLDEVTLDPQPAVVCNARFYSDPQDQKAH